MKIAVFHNLPSGGAIKSTYELISRLAKNNSIDVYALSCSVNQGYALSVLSEENVVFNYNISNKSNLKYFSPLAWIYDLYKIDRLHKKIAGVIDEKGYDVCLTHNCQFFETPSIHKYLSSKSVFFSRSTTYPQTYQAEKQTKTSHNPLAILQNRIEHKYKQTSIASCNKIITNSKFMNEELFKLYGVESDVCYVAIDTSNDYYPNKGD